MVDVLSLKRAATHQDTTSGPPTLVAHDWETHYDVCELLARRPLTDEDKRLIRESVFFGFRFIVQEKVLAVDLKPDPLKLQVSYRHLPVGPYRPYYQRGRW